jgi:hypothetical protein
MRYSLYEEDVEVSPVAKPFFRLISPQLDANLRRRKNGVYGVLGGRPRKNKPNGLLEEKPTGLSNSKPNGLQNKNPNKNVNKNGDNFININSSNNIKPKISSKTKTTPSKTNNTSSSNKPHKKVTNTSASKTPQEYEKNKRNNNSYKKPKQIIIEDNYNNINPNPSLRKNSKCLINNNFSKKTEISNRSNTKRKHKDKKQHYITGYANQQKLILQYQQKPKMNSFVKIITQNPITSSKSRNNSSTKVKTKTIIKTFSNHKHINNSNNSNKFSSLNHLMKQHLKKTPSKLTSTAEPGLASSQTPPPGSQKSGISVCQPSMIFWLKIPKSYFMQYP